MQYYLASLGLSSVIFLASEKWRKWIMSFLAFIFGLLLIGSTNLISEIQAYNFIQGYELPIAYIFVSIILNKFEDASDNMSNLTVYLLPFTLVFFKYPAYNMYLFFLSCLVMNKNIKTYKKIVPIMFLFYLLLSFFDFF